MSFFTMIQDHHDPDTSVSPVSSVDTDSSGSDMLDEVRVEMESSSTVARTTSLTDVPGTHILKSLVQFAYADVSTPQQDSSPPGERQQR